MKRRYFIKQSCSLCLAMGTGLMIGSMPSCASLSVYKTFVEDNKIAVPVSLFAKNELQIVRPKDFENDIALRKENVKTYSALLLRCTHADNQLLSTGNGFVCNLHGSRFDMEGQVTKGPAEYPLVKYPTEIISDKVIIRLI